MLVLKRLNVLLLFICMYMIFSCAPQAALTPQAAFYDLKKVIQKSDAAALARQLSRESIGRIGRVTASFAKMEDRQLESLAKKYKMPEERLRKLSVRDYCALILAADRDKNTIALATSYNIVGINREGIRAIIRVENGMELVFVKEGPYWKLDLSAI